MKGNARVAGIGLVVHRDWRGSHASDESCDADFEIHDLGNSRNEEIVK